MEFGRTELLTYFVTTLHILYILFLVGITTVNPTYITFFDKAVQLFIAVFLFYKFGIIKSMTITAFDSRVIFYCAYFLLVNLIATQLATGSSIRNYIDNMYHIK